MKKANIYSIIVKMQNKLNIDTAGDNYLEQGLNWNNAIIDESSELLTSLGYKWWKKQVIDIPNAKLESIDLLHFIISEDLNKNYKKDKSTYIEKTIETFEHYFEEKNQYFPNNPIYKIKDIKELVDEINYNKFNRFFVLKRIFKEFEVSNEDVYKRYIIKNCLNKFRQDKGYNGGFYIKIWNDVEDNVVAFELAKDLTISETLFDELYSLLNDYYHKNIEVKK